MNKSLATLLAVLVAAVGLQVANHVVVHDKLCSLADVGCGSVFGSGSVKGRWQGSASLPSAVRGAVVGFTAVTALVRKKCDGRWTAGFGARIDVDPLNLGESFSSERGCVEAGRTALRGEVVGARVSSGQCRLVFNPLRFEWNEALKLDAATSFDASTAATCGQLVSASSAVTEALSGARLALAASYAVPFAAPGETAPAATPATASGWLRSALGSMSTAQTLTLAGPQGTASFGLASAPPSAGAQSPELTLELKLDERVLAALPAEARGYLNEAGSLRIRWNMDHERGVVTVDDARIERGPQSFRPAGSSEPTADECGSQDTAKLLFVEANDEGQGNESQLSAVFEAVEANAGRDVVVTVFVHGWQHSAAPGDSYVCSFAALIRAVETMEQQAARTSNRPPRAVLGVYVGWPGELYPHEVANLVTTFWNRLGVADQVGAEGSVLPRLIHGLAQRLPAREGGGADRSSALVVAGHSLGARAVFNAVRNDIIARDEAALPDLVLLVNPAFSADLYRDVHEQRCAPATPVRLFSSQTDGVTRQVYPAGQTLSYRYAAEPPVPFLEHIYTAANFGEFVTHELRMDPGSNVPPGPNDEQTIRRGFLRVPNGTDLYSDIEVPVYRQPSSASGRPSSTDLWYTMRLESRDASAAACENGGARVIEVDTRILPNHGEIFTPPFMEYVVRALNVSIGRPE